MGRLRRPVAAAVLAVLLLTGPLWADTVLKAEIDKESVTTAEPLTYKLTVESSERILSTPKFPSFKGFAVLSQAQSSTMTFQKQTAKTILVYVFILLAREPGKFDIEPAQLTVRGKNIVSQAFSISVSAAAEGAGRLPPSDRLPRDLTGSRGPQYTL